jgi:Ca-activated chloride channel family protein
MSAWRLAAVIGLAGAGATAIAQTPSFRARVDGVRIDVLVTENGRPMTSLTAADFDVRDNGVPQRIDLVSLGDVGVSVVLALDLSASIQGARLVTLRRAGHALVDALAPSDSAALLTFDRIAVRRVPLTTARDEIRAALDGATPNSHTALIDATQAALLMGATDASRTVVMVFSDGVDTASYTAASVVVDSARRANSVLYAVSASDDATPFLREVTGATGGRVIEIEGDDDPTPAFLEILQEFRRRYVVTFTPTNGAAGGWHRLDVRVTRGNARVRARPGYFAAR